jgi:hypothetical protein
VLDGFRGLRLCRAGREQDQQGKQAKVTVHQSDSPDFSKRNTAVSWVVERKGAAVPALGKRRLQSNIKI